jgi:beta-carotene/zeaxanthin 4-ketolase
MTKLGSAGDRGLMDLGMPLLLLVGWSCSIWLVGAIDLSACPLGTVLLLLALRTFFQTGLFVTAHDAIHGSVVRDKPGLNRAIGQLCTFLYALLPYEQLASNHRRHHQSPATAADPDFRDQSCWRWYSSFMRSYLKADILLKIIVLMMGFLLAGLPIANLLLLGMIPIWLSSMQLFYFGTFLPHRALQANRFIDTHHARSSSLSTIWSLLTCYHFGYHWEHHEYPHLPWYQLPLVKKK